MPLNDLIRCPDPLREHLDRALLGGDRPAVEEMKKIVPRETLTGWKNALMTRLTDRYLKGSAPFCALTAAAQAARALYDPSLPPAACVGAVRGNESGTGRDYMMMLLTARGVPALDLGLNAGTDAFLGAVREHGLRIVVCAIFSDRDLESVAELHRKAEICGIREKFLLAACGAEHGSYRAEDFRLDCPEHRAAAVAEWAAERWK